MVSEGGLRAVIFDLDYVLIDSTRAWQYALEEAVAASTGRRLNAAPLVDEYRSRPWSHAVAVVVDDANEQERCERLCAQIMQRSAMKKLLVHEGVGMALDSLRNVRLEMGAISREPHSVALKQAQSTGIDRFLTVLAATPANEAWSPGDRYTQCLRFLEREPAAVAAVVADEREMAAARECGMTVFSASWVSDPPRDAQPVTTPLGLLPCLRHS